MKQIATFLLGKWTVADGLLISSAFLLGNPLQGRTQPDPAPMIAQHSDRLVSRISLQDLPPGFSEEPFLLKFFGDVMRTVEQDGGKVESLSVFVNVDRLQIVGGATLLQPQQGDPFDLPGGP